MAEQEEAVAFLSRGAEEVISTHISRVFLRGDIACKLKRAVKLPYVDYSSLAARKAFCEKELELNRRTAPDLYKRVRALTRAAEGGLEWDGLGAPVEYVLEMRRFPDDALLDRQAVHGPLPGGLLRDLTDAIAAFHDRAMIVPGVALDSVVMGNAERLRASCPPLRREEVAALNEATTAEYARRAGLLASRAAAGRVRRCHGDLHLGNILLLDGRPVLFDCIEFSESFACIDVLYDLAFLLMDLLHRGDAPGAAGVANRYLDVSADDAGLALLPLFISLRAAIRAHVCVAQGKGAEGEAYLALARRALRPGVPGLLAVGGFSGSGKSTLAAALAPHLAPMPGARVLRSDVIRKQLAGVAPETRLPDSAYTKDASAKVYDTLLIRAGEALRAGYGVILDAAFLEETQRRAAADLAARAGVAFQGFWLDAPSEVLEARLAARRGDASDADVEVLRAQLRAARPVEDWARLNAAGPLCREQALARLAAAGWPAT
ncbi:AAA family ATPase [Acidocella sp.]|uniref:bifunctional aminoglycoside phosphotransferase/ATP-binding protein n=1 Tax=Acidocella sp. TaxID=50710 RepID=UPI003D06D486